MDRTLSNVQKLKIKSKCSSSGSHTLISSSPASLIEIPSPSSNDNTFTYSENSAVDTDDRERSDIALKPRLQSCTRENNNYRNTGIKLNVKT